MNDSELATLFRRGFDAWTAGEFDRFAQGVWDPDIVLHDPPEMPDAGRHDGREAALRRFAEYTEPLGHFELEEQELLVRGDVVMVTARMSGRTPGAAVPFAGSVSYVSRFRDRRVVEVRVFFDRDAALAAAGIG